MGPDRRIDARDVAAVAVVAVALALPLRALFHQSGSPMEEGFMLVFPERVLEGDIPNRDFLHLYGPGSLWVLAAVYKVFGVALSTERAFGLLQQVGIIGAVMAVARPWGRHLMALCGVMAVLITVTPIGLTALAWDGGVACGLIAVVVGAAGRRAASDGHAGRARARFLASGLLGGVALLFRPDLVLAVGAGFACFAWGQARPLVARLVGAVAAVAGTGYLVHLVLAGPSKAIDGMLIEPVFRLRGGRHLPVPPSWDHYDGALQAVAQLVVPGWPFPATAGPHQVVLWFFLLPLAIAATIAVAGWRVRTAGNDLRHDSRARLLLAVGLFSLGMLPQAMQRPDTTHLSWVSCVPVALLPLVAYEVVRGRSTTPETASPKRWLAPGAALATAVVVLFGVMPYFTLRPYAELTRQSFRGDFFGFPVDRNGRTFYLGSRDIQPAAQALVDDLDRLSRPGQRLFVGTADLRKTPYSDAYLYHLFPDLDPATRYIEMDPGVANAEDSGLAEEVAGSDWLILSHVWDTWHEPNDAEKFGSDAPNRVVRRRFCLVDTYGNRPPGYLKLYRRCR